MTALSVGIVNAETSMNLVAFSEPEFQIRILGKVNFLGEP